MKNRKVMWWIVNAVGLSLVGVVVWAWYTLERASRDVERLRQEIYVRGVPATEQQLDDLYPAVADEDNAALVYMSSASKINLLDFHRQEKVPVYDQEDVLFQGNRMPPESLRLAREFITLNQEVLDNVRNAQAIQNARYPVALMVGQNLPNIEHLRGIENLVRLMELSALVHAEDGDQSSAIDDLVAGVAVARSLKTEPNDLSQMARVGMIAEICDIFSRVLSLVSLSEDSLDEFCTAIESASDSDSFQRTLNAAAFQRLDRFIDRDGRNNLLSAPAERRRLTYTIRVLDIADNDIVKSIDAFEALHRAVSNDPDYLLIGDLAILYRPFVNERIYRDLIMLIAAIEDFRVRTGGLPRAIADVNVERLSVTDPFSSQPYKYIQNKVGYTVYSVGINRADEFGTSGRRSFEGDIALNVAR